MTEDGVSDGVGMPAARPCASCPYRRHAPSGLWSRSEYDKLPRYDGETGQQAQNLFLCHQRSGRLCAGWVACHDMAESLAVRLALAYGVLTVAQLEALVVYVTDVPLWESGAAAAEHGMRDIEAPGARARAAIAKLEDGWLRGGTRPGESR